MSVFVGSYNDNIIESEIFLYHEHIMGSITNHILWDTMMQSNNVDQHNYFFLVFSTNVRQEAWFKIFLWTCVYSNEKRSHFNKSSSSLLMP